MVVRPLRLSLQLKSWRGVGLGRDGRGVEVLRMGPGASHAKQKSADKEGAQCAIRAHKSSLIFFGEK